MLTMQQEIDNLKLPLGRWQNKAFTYLGESCHVGRIDCVYPENHQRTLTMRIWESGVVSNLPMNYKMVDSTQIAEFSLSFLPGCKGVLISHGMTIAEKYRGNGISGKLLKLKEQITKDLKASILIVTVRKDDEIEHRVMHNGQFQLQFEFLNQRTGIWITLYTKGASNDI